MKSVRPISTGIGLVYAKPKSANSPGVFCTNEKERKSAKIYTYTTHNTTQNIQYTTYNITQYPYPYPHPSDSWKIL
jgi:hypothetical protein